MLKRKSLKAYILFWITLLALCMSVLLTYQSTQYFLGGFDMVQEWQMNQAADLLPQGETSSITDFGYHVTRNWENVPEEIKKIFPQPPTKHRELQVHCEDWWYFAPPEKLYSLLSAPNQAGEIRYISRILDSKEKKAQLKHEGLDPMVIIALWGLGSLAAFIGIIYIVLSNLADPIQSLYNWAKNLDLKQTQEPPSDFHYEELNQLAGIVHASIQDVGRTLEREKAFLGFASHELRTPIATLRSNATLLDKISPKPSAKERDVRDRILRSSLTMKGITETLLWLNRDNQEDIQTSLVNIEDTLRQVVQELEYLVSGKNIEMSIQTQACSKHLPEAAFRILIGNIIRNAFQHTTSGTIQVIQNNQCVQVINTLPSENVSNQTGFGLGLKLIKKLVERFNWQLIEEERDARMHMSLVFDELSHAHKQE